MHFDGYHSDSVVVFRSPHPDVMPFYLAADKWERMEKPQFLRVSARAVDAIGQPLHGD